MQLVLRIQKRIFAEDWKALRWTPAAPRLAYAALAADAVAAPAAHRARQRLRRPTKVCANPYCRSMDGPSALIAPSEGKTCSRCRRLTYCCGACQLEHWTETPGRHAPQQGPLGAC